MYGQEFNKSINKDSLFQIIIQTIPKDKKDEVVKAYETSSDKDKEFLLLVLSMPISSKDELIKNIDLNYGKINVLKIDMNNKSFVQKWNLEYNSDSLNKMLKLLNWTNETLKTIKKMLVDANCVSIENGENTKIGFARSGFGKYSYLLFNKDLTTEQIKEYNDGCSYIFYKNNIVLEYGGGALGPQCFPD